MSDEVWWIRKGKYAYYQYYDRAVAEAERDGVSFNYDRVFSDEEWASLGGEELAKSEIIAIRPLRIERVEVSDGQ